MKLLVCPVIGFLTFVLTAAAADLKSPGTAAERTAPVFESAEQLTTESSGGFSTVEDGTNVLVLKFRTNSSPATKLRLSNLRLPLGAKLYVFGISDGAVTRIAGPWEGAGPRNGEPFETPALTGGEIALELQVPGDELPADLPFQVTGIIGAGAEEEVPAAGPVETRTSLFRGMVLTHEVRDGQAVFEGDILLAEEELRPANAGKDGRRDSIGITGARYRWPGGVVPYRIDPALPNQARITSAIAHWNAVMAGLIKLEPFSGQTAHIYFARPWSPGQCASNVGMLGYMQYVWIGDQCSTGNTIHEIGHAVGLWHEHTREDRDQHVKILWSNISTSAQHNFTQNIQNADDLGTYDYGSIMHYPAYAFSINGQPAIETIPLGIPIGQRSGLSAGDIAGVRAMYGDTAPPVPTPPPAPSPVAVTVSADPSGLPFTVDGTEYTSQVTLSWVPGTTHTISTIASRTLNGTRAKFVNWSDGGALSHSVVAPSIATGYKAIFSQEHSVTVAAAGAGTATISPMATDAFYPSNANVSLNATPAAGNCFGGWYGLLTGAPAATTLSVTKPYALQALFQPGAVTLPIRNYYIAGSGATIGIGVQATSGCQWKAVASVSWIRFITNVTGTGPGTVSAVVDPNPTSWARTGALSIGGRVAIVSQAGKTN